MEAKQNLDFNLLLQLCTCMELLHGQGINLTDFRVMLFVSLRNHPNNQRTKNPSGAEVARALGLTLSGANRSIKLLEESGFLEKSPDTQNLRSSSISLGVYGQDLLRKILEQISLDETVDGGAIASAELKPEPENSSGRLKIEKFDLQTNTLTVEKSSLLVSDEMHDWFLRCLENKQVVRHEALSTQIRFSDYDEAMFFVVVWC